MTAPESVVETYVEAYNDRDLETLGELFNDPFQFNGDSMHVDDFLGLVQNYWEVFPDLILDHTHRIVEGEFVFDRHTFEAEATGEYYGHDVAGRSVESSEMMLFRVRNGTIEEYWYEWDELGFWNQLGILADPYADG
ncbi:MAG: ester cyclase [Halobacteriota archaeon]